MVGDMVINLYRTNVWASDLNVWGIRRAFVSDMNKILEFLKENFPEEKGWALEVEKAVMNDTCLISADTKGEIEGFSCWDATAKGYLGPIGVKESSRGLGAGSNLVCKCLDEMKSHGYGYAIVGWVSESVGKFYKKVADAVFIPNSEPWQTLYSRKVGLGKSG